MPCPTASRQIDGICGKKRKNGAAAFVSAFANAAARWISAFLSHAEEFAKQGLEQRRGFDHDDLHKRHSFRGCLLSVYAAPPDWGMGNLKFGVGVC